MREYLQKTAEYTAGNLFNKFVLFLFLPIFTKFMAPEEYAVYANILIFISLANVVYTLGLQQAIFSYFYQKKTDEYHYIIISTIYTTLFFVGMFFSFIIILFRNELSYLILRSEQYSNLFFFASIILFCDVLCGITLSFLNIMEKSRSYVILSIFRNSILLIILFLGAINNRFSLENVFTYISVAAVISFLLSTIFIWNEIKKFSLKLKEKKYFSFLVIKKLLNFGLIIIPGTLAMISLKVFDRYMLTYLSPGKLYDVGIYAIGYKIGMIIIFLNSIVNRVCFPYAMKIKDQPNAKDSYKKIYNYYIVSAGILGGLIIIFTKEIFHFFINSSYTEAMNIVVFAVISNYLLGIFNIINLGFYIKKRAVNISAAVGAGAILNIIMNFFLIPYYGIYGACLASVVAYFFIVVFNYYFSRKVYPVKYRFIFVIYALCLLILFSVFNFYTELNIRNFFIKCGLITIFLLFLVIYFYKTNKYKFIINLFCERKKA